MKNIFKIFRFMIPYKGRIVAFVILSILLAIFSVASITAVLPFLQILFKQSPVVANAVPWALNSEAILHNVKYFISQYIVTHGEIATLSVLSVCVALLFLFKNMFEYLTSFVMIPLRNGVVMDIRMTLYRKVLELPLGYYSNERKGDILSKMTNDVNEIEVSVVRSLELLFKDPLLLIAYLTTLIIISPQLSLFVLGMIFVTVFILGRIGRSLRKTSYKAQNSLGDILSAIEETLSGLRVVKGFIAEKHMTKKFKELNDRYRKLCNHASWRRDLASPLSEFLGVSVVVAVLMYGGRLVLQPHPTLTAAALITYLAAFSQLLNPAKRFSQSYYNIIKGMASADRIDAILSAENPIKDTPTSQPIVEFKSKIEFRNVSFKYIDDWVLRNVSFTVEKGKTIALVGQSGSGKSTIVDLLPRFWDIQEGEILVDGVNVKDYKLRDLRSLMGIVNQEPILFNDTYYNNIAFSVEGATADDVEAAAKVANAHEFVSTSPEGYQTVVGDRGSKMSGGQRQRVSIARAVLANPPILILDEATSALDTESEKIVQSALDNLMQNRTSIVIAHRLSTIKNADEILVINEGEIAERGTHDELLTKKGIYHKLHTMQQ
jgi:ABC-type multidrug transport system fused ATPase/permease subunit